MQHKYHKKEHYIIIDGIKIYLDKHDGLRLSEQIYEQEIIEWMKQKVKPNDHVIDIGANIGYYTTILAKIVGDKGMVYAFEPEPYNYSMVLKNVKANGFNNVQVYNNAVGNEKRTINLYKAKNEYMDKGGNGMHRIYPSIFCDEKIQVDMVRLDDIINHDVSLVKIDAEGSELDVLKGMTRILNQEHLSILVEYGPACIMEKGDNPYETIEILRNAGFTIDNIEWLYNGNLTDDIRVKNLVLDK